MRTKVDGSSANLQFAFCNFQFAICPRVWPAVCTAKRWRGGPGMGRPGTAARTRVLEFFGAETSTFLISRMGRPGTAAPTRVLLVVYSCLVPRARFHSQNCSAHFRQDCGYFQDFARILANP